MSGILLDTHAWVWSFDGSGQLSDRAKQAIVDANSVYISPISFFEIGQKSRIGKWPEIEAHLPNLLAILHEQGGLVAPLSPEICLAASLTEWVHRDPFDRLIAATAEKADLILVTRDPAFATLPGLSTIW